MECPPDAGRSRTFWKRMTDGFLKKTFYLKDGSRVFVQDDQSLSKPVYYIDGIDGHLRETVSQYAVASIERLRRLFPTGNTYYLRKMDRHYDIIRENTKLKKKKMDVRVIGRGGGATIFSPPLTSCFSGKDDKWIGRSPHMIGSGDVAILDTMIEKEGYRQLIDPQGAYTVPMEECVLLSSQQTRAFKKSLSRFKIQMPSLECIYPYRGINLNSLTVPVDIINTIVLFPSMFRLVKILQKKKMCWVDIKSGNILFDTKTNRLYLIDTDDISPILPDKSYPPLISPEMIVADPRLHAVRLNQIPMTQLDIFNMSWVYYGFIKKHARLVQMYLDDIDHLFSQIVQIGLIDRNIKAMLRLSRQTADRLDDVFFIARLQENGWL